MRRQHCGILTSSNFNFHIITFCTSPIFLRFFWRWIFACNFPMGIYFVTSCKAGMAVANALGANVQNVFLALAIPWTIQVRIWTCYNWVGWGMFGLGGCPVNNSLVCFWCATSWLLETQICQRVTLVASLSVLDHPSSFIKFVFIPKKDPLTGRRHLQYGRFMELGLDPLEFVPGMYRHMVSLKLNCAIYLGNYIRVHL